MYPDRLLGVNLGAVSRPLAIHFCEHAASPFEAIVIWGTPEKFRARLSHAKWHIRRVFQLGQALSH